MKECCAERMLCCAKPMTTPDFLRSLRTPYHFVLSRLPRFFNPCGWWPNRRGDNESDLRGRVKWDCFSSLQRFGTAFCITPRRVNLQPRRLDGTRVGEAPALSESPDRMVSVSDMSWSSRGSSLSSAHRYSRTTTNALVYVPFIEIPLV